MLTLKNVSFQVNNGDSDLGIVNDVSFTLEDGKFLVITGPNGGGKIYSRPADYGHRKANLRSNLI